MHYPFRVARVAFCALALSGAACTMGDAAAAPAAGAAPAHVVVLYNQPKDTAAFEKYYSETHLPLLAANAKEIGFTKGLFVKFTSTLDGKPPTIYRKAELTFSSMAALKKGVATPGFKKVADDIANFATGGATALMGVETK
jgi:uncharacterized protein (TIGR02118 family)